MIYSKYIISGFLVASLILAGCGSEQADNNSTSTVQQQEQKAEAPKKVEKAKTLQQQALEDNNASMNQKNALKKAISYANNMHMSKARVYRQLTSEHGAKFPEEDAQWAMERLSDIDWKKNALESAKNYAGSSMHMSKSRVYNQLISDHGAMFTEEEAQWAMEHLTADWKKNALESAKNYQNNMAMSIDRIRQQLVSPHGGQFTEEEAQYAIDNLPK